MKTLLTLIFISLTLVLNGQDLQADVNQSTFDKIISSAKIPMTLFEYRDPFQKLVPDVEKDMILADDLTTRSFTVDESRNYFKWAVEERAKVNDEEAVLKNALQAEWEKVRDQIQIIIEENDKIAKESLKGVTKEELTYQDYTIEEFRKLQDASVEETFKFFNVKEKGAFSVKTHLSYFRLDLNKRPGIKVASPNFDVNNIRVEPTVTGELWTKLPVFHCCRRILGVCVCVRVTWEWKKIASLTVSPDIGADATITFSESHLKIVAKARFRKLFLDYVIIREINLAGIANHFLNDKAFEVYDASLFVASLPYINSNFRIESLTIPVNPNGLKVQVNIKQ